MLFPVKVILKMTCCSTVVEQFRCGWMAMQIYSKQLQRDKQWCLIKGEELFGVDFKCAFIIQRRR